MASNATQGGEMESIEETGRGEQGVSLRVNIRSWRYIVAVSHLARFELFP